MTQEEELKWLRNIIRQLPGNVYWKDKEGNVLGCNKNNADLYHMEPEDVTGIDECDYLPFEIAQSLREVDKHVYDQQESVMLEEVCTNADGVITRYLSCKAPLKDIDDRVIGIIGTSLNIEDYKKKETALLQQQDRLRLSLEQIFNVMPGNVYWKNEQGEYLGCNDNLARVLGLASPKAIVGKKDVDLMSHSLAVEVSSIDTKVMATGKMHVVEELGVNEVGSTATYFTQKVPLVDEEGQSRGLLGISLDISDRKKMEHDLNEAKEQAEFSSKSKTEMILNMSHDLRTPCANIVGMAYLIKEKHQADQIRQELDSIIESSESLLSLLDETLASAKVTETDSLIVNDYFNLNEVLRSAVSLVKPSLIDKKVNYAIDVDNVFQSELIGDKNKLYRIVINLLTNAVKFTKQGHVKVIVSQQDEGNHTATLSIVVQDTGIGIPKEKINYVFEKFSRLNPAYEGVYKGTGVGLFIVKRFVDLMGGSVMVDSAPHHGSTFTVTVPVQLVPLERMKSEQVGVMRDFSSLRVLIVEDNAIARKITESLIEGYGCQVDFAVDARDALSKPLEEYDLIVLDIGLPDMDGYQLAEKITCRLKGQVPLVVGLTAHATLDGSANNYIKTMYTKPLSQEVALMMLEATLDYQSNRT